MLELDAIGPEMEPGTGLAGFGQSFAQSDAFQSLFREGMDLVEEAAFYLDGAGRAESRNLSRPVSIAYASESMRLTTRLMQIASWLLILRGMAEGGLSSDQAQIEKARLRLLPPDIAIAHEDFDALPPRLKELIGLSARLYTRINHLDCLLGSADERPEVKPNPVRAQQHRLLEAFGAAR